MRRIFVDTGAWDAIADRGDKNHKAALRFREFAKRAWEVFERFNMDMKWSFTDCTSYAVMNEMEISEVFAFDRHFDQMKFVRKP